MGTQMRKEMTMWRRTAPNWDDLAGRKVFIPFFIYGRDDLDVGPLEGSAEASVR